MGFDIVFPNGNEKEFISMAERLGFEALVLVYPKQKKPEFKSNLELIPGVIVSKNKPPKGIISVARAPGRHCFEKLRPRVVFELESSVKKDKTHFRISGLDDVLCRIANKNNTVVGFSAAELLNTKLPRSVVLGRMIQNIRFCRRFKVKMMLGSFASEPYDMRAWHDLKALGIALGMTPKETHLVDLDVLQI